MPITYHQANTASGSPSSVLLIDTQLNLAQREAYHRSVRRLDTIQGVQNHSQVEINFDPEIEDLIVHHVTVVRDQSSTESAHADAFKLIQRESNLEVQIYDTRLSAVLLLQDVQVGDSIDVAYTLRSHSPLFENQLTHWHHSDYPFSVATITLSVTVPSAANLYYRTSRQDDQPEISETATSTIHRWIRHGVPANTIEPGAPTSLIQGNWLQLTTYGSWQEIASEVTKKWHTVAASCPALDAKIAEIKATAALPEDQALLATDFIQNEFRYLAIANGIGGWTPSPIATAFNRRFADCKDKAALLCALIHRLGIPVRPVLVHSQLLGRINDLLPSTGLFDHVIVQMNIGGGSVFIDPSLQDQRGIIRNRATPCYHYGLPIDPSIQSLVHIEPPSKKRDNIEVTERYVLAQRSFEPTAIVSTRVTGMEADKLRHRIRILGGDKASEQLAAHYTTKYPGASRVGEIEEHEEEHGDSGLVVSEQFVLPEFGTTLNDGSTIRFLCSAHSIASRLVNPTYKERHTPLSIPFPIRITHQIDIETPGSKRLPKSEKKVVDKHFTLTVKSESSVKGIRLHYTFISLAPEVKPRDLRSYLDHVSEASNLLKFQLDIPLLRGFPFRHKSSKPLTDEQPDFADLDSAPKSGLANRKTGAVAPLHRQDGQDTGTDYTLDLDELIELEQSVQPPEDPHVLDQQGRGGRAPALKESAKSFIVGSGDDTMQRWTGTASHASALNIIGILGAILVLGVLYAAFTGTFSENSDDIYARPD
ncbi:MAG: DUF3857 domain-containing protein, partial [Verrucomicrobiales bacterium]|nr:DUF3857 domain-containing protein [Verrucomicrobiales bacterium]